MQAIKQEKIYTQGQLKLTHINFVILNSYVRVIYLRFIKKHLFLGGKTEKSKIGVLAFFKRENCYNKMTSVRKSYISKPVKKQKTITF